MDDWYFIKLIILSIFDIYQTQKFSDAGIQDISACISIEFNLEYIDDLTERCDNDDESDKHLEARDRR